MIDLTAIEGAAEFFVPALRPLMPDINAAIATLERVTGKIEPEMDAIKKALETLKQVEALFSNAPVAEVAKPAGPAPAVKPA